MSEKTAAMFGEYQSQLTEQIALQKETLTVLKSTASSLEYQATLREHIDLPDNMRTFFGAYVDMVHEGTTNLSESAYYEHVKDLKSIFETLKEFSESALELPDSTKQLSALVAKIGTIDKTAMLMASQYTDSNGIAGIYATQIEQTWGLSDYRKRLEKELEQGLITQRQLYQRYAQATKEFEGMLSGVASNSINYYFGQITSLSDAMFTGGEVANAVAQSFSLAYGKLKSLSDVLSISLSYNPDNEVLAGQATIISDATKELMSKLSTENAEEVKYALDGITDIGNISEETIRQLSILIGEVGKYDNENIGIAFNTLNAQLIKANITEQQYGEIFNVLVDRYEGTNIVLEEQLSVLEDIRDYQRSLLLGDESGLNTVGRYNYASIETASLAQQAKDALLGGDVNAFNSLFSEYKDISSQFLGLSKDLSANQATYMNDFIKVYSVIDELGNMVDGSHANGLDYVPFDGYRAELHKGERVQTASEVQKDTVITELKNELRELKEIFLKNTAETTRMSKAIQRVIPDGDAISVRTAV